MNQGQYNKMMRLSDILDADKKTKAFVFLELKVVEGDKAHYHRSVHTLPIDSRNGLKNLDKWAKGLAETYYIGYPDWNKSEECWEFEAGGVWVYVEQVREIPEADYITLKKYL